MQSGIDKQQIIALNFEDLEFEDLLDYRDLYKYLLTLDQVFGEMNYDGICKTNVLK